MIEKNFVRYIINKNHVIFHFRHSLRQKMMPISDWLHNFYHHFFHDTFKFYCLWEKGERKTMTRGTHRLLGKRPPSFNPFLEKQSRKRNAFARGCSRSAEHFRSSTLRARDRDSGPRMGIKTNQRERDRDVSTFVDGIERDRAASTWTSTWTCVPCKNDGDVSAAGTAVGGTRATKVAAARRDTQVRLCLRSLARSLARTARSVARAIRKLLANAWHHETRRMRCLRRRCTTATPKDRERERERSREVWSVLLIINDVSLIFQLG